MNKSLAIIKHHLLMLSNDKLVKAQAVVRGFLIRKRMVRCWELANEELRQIAADLVATVPRPAAKDSLAHLSVAELLAMRDRVEQDVFCTLDLINHRTVFLAAQQ